MELNTVVKKRERVVPLKYQYKRKTQKKYHGKCDEGLEGDKNGNLKIFNLKSKTLLISKCSLIFFIISLWNSEKWIKGDYHCRTFYSIRERKILFL